MTGLYFILSDFNGLPDDFVFLYFFELQALALYQSSDILSKRLGEVSYTGRASAAHPHARLPALSSCEAASGQLRGLLRGQLRALLLRIIGMIVVETLPVAYSSISVD